VNNDSFSLEFSRTRARDFHATPIIYDNENQEAYPFLINGCWVYRKRARPTIIVCF
jgi:hypothetical protein